jgi:hypothetical protein
LLEAQDILIWLKFLVARDSELEVPDVAEELCMPCYEVYDAMDRAEKEGVFDLEKRVIRPSGLLKLFRNLPHVLYERPEKMARGMPTALSGPPFSEKYNFKDKDTYVWPDPSGKVRGLAIKPLYHLVPELAKRDSELYEWLNIIETIRVGRRQERVLAFDICQKRLATYQGS